MSDSKTVFVIAQEDEYEGIREPFRVFSTRELAGAYVAGAKDLRSYGTKIIIREIAVDFLVEFPPSEEP